MTGFGRTGSGATNHPGDAATSGLATSNPKRAKAPHEMESRENILLRAINEGIQPDLLAVAKGLSGGYVR